MILAIVCWGVFVGVLEARHWGEACEVSQVFKLSKSVHLAGDNYAGFYNVAVTPPNKMAQICGLFALTPVPYLNLLDKQVWLLPLDQFQFAYYETPNAKRFLWGLFVSGLIFLVLAYALFREKEK